jgi:hypothetical protein
MMIKNLVVIGLLILGLNCSNKQDQSVNNHSVKDKSFDSLVNKDDNKHLKLLSDPIGIENIKELSFLEVTSGVVAISESEKLCAPSDIKGFFGHYQLINKIKHTYIGQLIVFAPVEPKNWTYDNNSDMFVKIDLEKEDISVWDSVKVGMNKKDLIDFLGKDVKKKGDFLIADVNNYESEFTILKGTVKRIKVTRSARHINAVSTHIDRTGRA